jgi:hypothetical protein
LLSKGPHACGCVLQIRQKGHLRRPEILEVVVVSNKLLLVSRDSHSTFVRLSFRVGFYCGPRCIESGSVFLLKLLLKEEEKSCLNFDRSATLPKH